MSRQNKAAKQKKIAEGYSNTRKSGNSGPASTTPKHGKAKSNRWFMKGITAIGKKALGLDKKSKKSDKDKAEGK